MHILLVCTRNTSAIVSKSYDVRFELWTNIINKLKTNNTIYYSVLDYHIYDKKYIDEHTLFNMKEHKNKIDVIICWQQFLYYKKRNELYYNYFTKLRDEGKTVLCFEHGWLNESVLIDNGRLFSNSCNVENLDEQLELYDKDDCLEYQNELLANRLSKRQQKDIPIDITNYIFIPLQKISDIAITRYGNGYNLLDFVKRVVNYVKKYNIPIVIKYHPHTTFDNNKISTLINELQLEYNHIYIKNDSHIYDLCKNALFTVCINGGSIADNIITQTPVLTCGKSMFYTSGTVVYNTHLETGLDIMINNKYDADTMMMKQLQMIGWFKHKLLYHSLDVDDNIQRIEKEINIELM
jgi:hypothetical protein